LFALSPAAIHIASACCCCTPAPRSPPLRLSHLQKSCAASFIHPGRIAAAAKTPKHSIKKKRSGITGGALNAACWLAGCFFLLLMRERESPGKMYYMVFVRECVCCAQGVSECEFTPLEVFRSRKLKEQISRVYILQRRRG
jgi:hypothetical protein